MRQEWETGSVIGGTRQPGSAYTTPQEELSEVRSRAFALLADFQTVLQESKSAGAEESIALSDALTELRQELPLLIARFERVAEVGDTTVLGALRDALNEVEPLQAELRQRIPGRAAMPIPNVDVDALRAEIAERAARRTLGGTVTNGTASRYETDLRRSSMAGIPLLIFGTGWLSFTTLHATLMIGGMSKAVGGAAFFLVPFYGIFFAVGFGMLWGGISMFRKERMVLSDGTLTLRYNLFGYQWEKSHPLDKRSRAWVTTPLVQSKGSNAQEIALLTGHGKEIRMGNGLPHPLLYEEADHINDYIQGMFGGAGR